MLCKPVFTKPVFTKDVIKDILGRFAYSVHVVKLAISLLCLLNWSSGERTQQHSVHYVGCKIFLDGLQLDRIEDGRIFEEPAI